MLQSVMEDKLADVEKHKNDLIARIKQTTSKLKFTLKGSEARDAEFLTMALGSARERLSALEECIKEADTLNCKSAGDQPGIPVSRHVVLQCVCVCGGGGALRPSVSQSRPI